MAELVLIGIGAQARCALDIAAASGRSVVGLIDIENGTSAGQTVNGGRILGTLGDIDSLIDPASCELVIGYGDTRRKREVAERLQDRYRFSKLISPMACISPESSIEEGCIIHSGVVVMANTNIGRHVHINPGCVIAHDNVIDDFVGISPGVALAGYVRVGTETQIYTGARIIPRVTVGSECVVGAGAVVLRDVADGLTVVGNPARPLDSSAAS